VARVQDWALGDGKEGRDVALALGCSTRLRHLALCNTGIATHTPRLLGAAFPSLTSLETLDLSCNRLGAGGLRLLAPGLSRLPALTELNLRATALHDAGALSFFFFCASRGVRVWKADPRLHQDCILKCLQGG
jgi:Ran GTPase-activating protein (RanGAP) involved in mRNA processing and transport